MARKEVNTPKPDKPDRGFRFVRATGAVVLGIGILAGVAAVGAVVATAIGLRDRYRIPLAALDCDPPAWVNGDELLAEIRYSDNLPDSFPVNDPAAIERIRAALARHPWVEFVADDGYFTVARRYQLTVGFRRPVLSVTTKDPPAVRSVDAKGVLLPVHEPMSTVARLVNPLDAPAAPAGSLWPDPTVTRAAELAGIYEPVTIERLAAGWRLVLQDGTAVRIER